MVAKASGTFDTHFTAGRKRHVEDVLEVTGMHNWWRATAFLAISGLILSMGGNIVQGLARKDIPYFIRWDSASGDMQPLTLAPAAPQEPVTIRLWLREWVTTLYGISTDKELVRQRWNVLFTRLTADGRKQAVAWEATRKPLTPQPKITVEVLRMLRKTGQTWEVRWQEVREATETDRQHTDVFSGLFTFQQRVARTQAELDYNPAGLFLHEWSLSHE